MFHFAPSFVQSSPFTHTARVKPRSVPRILYFAPWSKPTSAITRDAQVKARDGLEMLGVFKNLRINSW
jgi:hypothetical protein